ncbi:hypothetical protein AK812_SmicGene7410 [Symbiodinium microadriaticum]|uniref:Uncharacterized protein n=1 Tax=Symbiodinium microadriaticum TaxID=2951 RepID=A0A1Q9ENQ9_SYMMI|nr:hypothetical protein AK812_SmicGene7410 [Symbiodinium microadriaticum]
MVLQYGRWFEKEKILITPMAPFMWAWPAGKPADAPYWGAMYGQTTTMVGARILCGTGLPRPPSPATYSLKFSGEDLTYAVIQAGHDLTQDMVNVGSLLPPCSCLTCLRGKFTLELQPSTLQEPGSHWKRGIWWGPGTCTFCPFGGYNFVKVIRGDGEPNEPYYSEFLKYMDEIKLFTWSGFPDSERQSPDFRTLEEAVELQVILHRIPTKNRNTKPIAAEDLASALEAHPSWNCLPLAADSTAGALPPAHPALGFRGNESSRFDWFLVFDDGGFPLAASWSGG